MKICQINPGCGIPIPPPSWGAIEKIVWDFTCNLKELGHEVDIKWANEIQPGEYDLVMVHVANLALELANKLVQVTENNNSIGNSVTQANIVIDAANTPTLIQQAKLTRDGVINTINNIGNLVTNAPIFGENSKTTRTLLQYTNPDFQIFSGYISYVENRPGIQRSSDSVEQFKFVLGY